MHPRIFIVALTIAAILGFFVGRCTAPGVRGNSYRDSPVTIAKGAGDWMAVEGVIDGDTLVVLNPGGLDGRERVRLLAIDTPERGQTGYVEARLALTDLVGKKRVNLEFEDEPRRDKYGRVLAYVIIDGLNANVEMVRLGWTPFASKLGGDRYERELITAEEEARAARRGIWASR